MNRPTVHRPALGILLIALVFGCSSTPEERLEELYEESAEELGSEDLHEQAEVEQERMERIGEVKEILQVTEGLRPIERLYAASVLLDSNDPDDLLVARDLALSAAEDGEEQGFPIAAEAIDRNLMIRRLPQRYGTQIVYIPVTGRWVMYRLEAGTTDTMRAAMGVPTLEELMANLERLNRDR